MNNFNPHPLSPNKSNKILSAFVVFLEVTLPFALFIFVLVILNYFNSPRLDYAFPFLSFLPHQKEKIATKNSISQKNITLPPGKIIPDNYSYSQSNAENIFKSYVITALNKQYLPPTFNLTHQLSEDGSKNATENVYSTSWKSSNYKSEFFLRFDKDTNNLADVELTFTASQGFFSINKEDELRKIFIIDTIRLTCKKNIVGADVCEDFSTLPNGVKKGIGIITNVNQKNSGDGYAIFSCQHPPKSSLYNWKSCIQQYAESGL